jgi:hypothetical protein
MLHLKFHARANDEHSGVRKALDYEPTCDPVNPHLP